MWSLLITRVCLTYVDKHLEQIPGLDRLSRWDPWIVCLEIFGIPMGLPAPDIYPLSPLLVIRLHWMRITNMESAPTER